MPSWFFIASKFSLSRSKKSAARLLLSPATLHPLIALSNASSTVTPGEGRGGDEEGITGVDCEDEVEGRGDSKYRDSP